MDYNNFIKRIEKYKKQNTLNTNIETEKKKILFIINIKDNSKNDYYKYYVLSYNEVILNNKKDIIINFTKTFGDTYITKMNSFFENEDLYNIEIEEYTGWKTFEEFRWYKEKDLYISYNDNIPKNLLIFNKHLIDNSIYWMFWWWNWLTEKLIKNISSILNDNKNLIVNLSTIKNKYGYLKILVQYNELNWYNIQNKIDIWKIEKIIKHYEDISKTKCWICEKSWTSENENYFMVVCKDHKSI